MAVFELSQIQAQYILDTPLRRLTRYDRLELEEEQQAAREEIASLTAILESDELLRNLVGDELAEVAKKFATPRRTVLLEGSAAVTAAAAVPLEVADDPCVVLMSATGLLARVAVSDQDLYAERTVVPAAAEATRAAHDVLTAAVRATTRGTIGVVTSAGRLVKVNVLELPALVVPGGAAASLAGAAAVSEFAALEPGETAVGLCAVDAPGGGLALGTAGGVVKRVLPEYPQNREEFELIALRDGDRVVGAAQLSGESDELVFVTSDAQLLRFGASSVRPQGRAAGGMARRPAVFRRVSGVVRRGGRGGGVRVAVRRAGDLLPRRSGDRGGPGRRAAGHGGGQREGHPAARVPRQGPGNRRGPLPPVPQGRGSAGHGLGRARARRGRDRGREPGHPAGPGRQARRVGHRAAAPAGRHRRVGPGAVGGGMGSVAGLS